MSKLGTQTIGFKDAGISEVSLFQQLSSAVAELGASINVDIVPFRDSSLPHFSKQEPEKRQLILTDLKNYVDVCQATKSQGYQLTDGPRLLWNAIKQSKLRPTSDLFQFAPDGNVIEIHNHQLVQTFRNFKFYECCSYSLEELYCFPWTELYKRDKGVEQELVKAVLSIFDGKVTRTMRLNIAPHIISEVSSPNRYDIQAETRYLSPLYDEGTGQVAATVVIEHGTVLNPQHRLSTAADAAL